MFPEVSAATTVLLNSLKSLDGLRKRLRDSELSEVIFDFQQNLLDLQAKLASAQAKYDELAQSKRAVEEELTKHHRWEEQARQYRLEELTPGIFAYAYRPAQEGTDPFHYACPTCFQKQCRSILQHPFADNKVYECHACKQILRPIAQSMPFAVSVPRRRGSIEDLF